MQINKETITDLLEKIPSKLDRNFTIDQKIDLSDDFGIPNFEQNNRVIHNKSDYILYQLNQNISDYLIKLWYHIDDQVISEPKIAGPDFVIDCKTIYQSNPELNFSEFIKKLSQDILWYEDKLISKIVSQGIFVNIYVSDYYISSLIWQVRSYRWSFGNINIWYKNQKWIVEYSSPNMAKSMSMWHFRNTIIWDIISNLTKSVWVDTILRNYLWDWWTPFGKFIYSLYCQYEQNHDIVTKILDDPTVMMGKIYADYKDIGISDKDDHARKIFSLLEKWDKDLFELWKIIRQLTLQDFAITYDKLWVSFDTYLGEYFATTLSWDIIVDLKWSDYAVESDWAYVVRFKKTDDTLKREPLKSSQQADFNPDTDQVLVVSKSWDNTLYATRDLAMCKFRSQQLWADKMIYVVWSEQRVYFEQIISLATYLWYIRNDQMVHLGYGLYMQDGKKMSTRKWTVFRVMELIDEISDKIWLSFEDRIDKDTADKLAISTLIFNDIKWDLINDVNFDIGSITKLNWDNGIYLQYTYTRIMTLINKIKESFDIDNDLYGDDQISSFDQLEKTIISKLWLLPSKISTSLINYKPHILAQYTLELAWLVNKRYSKSPKIVDLEKNIAIQKLMFLDSVTIVFEKIFDIFWFSKIEKM